jgi:glutaconate CoA-transferase subunit A
VKGGAFPSYAHGYYARANAFYKQWDDVSRDRESFRAWMQRHVRETTDFDGFRRTLEQTAVVAGAPATAGRGATRDGGSHA